MITAAYFIPFPSDFGRASAMRRLSLLDIIEKDITAFRRHAAPKKGRPTTTSGRLVSAQRPQWFVRTAGNFGLISESSLRG